MQGRREEIILRSQLELVSEAAEKACALPGASIDDLKLVIQVIERKKDFPGTKVQMKPSFDKETGALEKMQLIIKWGGEVCLRAITRLLAPTPSSGLTTFVLNCSSLTLHAIKRRILGKLDTKRQ